MDEMVGELVESGTQQLQRRLVLLLSFEGGAGGLAAFFSGVI